MRVFNPNDLKKLYKPEDESLGEDNGQVTVVGGSRLFHGAPLLSLKVASRIVDMVFFATPEPSVGRIAEKIKSELFSFIWVPWEDTEKYIEKSDACLIGPGLMRYGGEIQNSKLKIQKFDQVGQITREITRTLLGKFSDKKWVIDAGSLQVMDPEWIPENAVLTPNRKEFELLFGKELGDEGLDYEDEKILPRLQTLTLKYKCIIVLKGPKTIICSPNESVLVGGGNAGLTKGGTGDVLAGLTVALLAKNNPFLAASAASYITKKAADELFKNVGTNYNANDLADKIPETLSRLLKET